MNWVLLVVAVVAGLVVAAALLLPATTRTTVEIRFDAPIAAVWAVYADFESQPNWRSDVGKVEVASDRRSWTETFGFVPKVMRRLFFNQRKFIEEYAREAKAEIARRESKTDR